MKVLLVSLLLLFALPALALQAFTTMSYGTVATTNVYQLALPLTAANFSTTSNFRAGCLIQNTSAATEYVYFDRTGTTPPSGTTSSFQLAGGQALSCAAGDNVVLDAI